MKWRAGQLKVMYLLVSILVFGSLNTKVASVLTKSIFFSLKTSATSFYNNAYKNSLNSDSIFFV